MAGDFPANWYQYEFPLPEVPNAPVPSKADYSPHNCAWLIEMFAQMLGVDHTEIRLRYENNTPNNRNDDIFVEHPNDGLYLTEAASCRPDSPEMFKYEQKAQNSKILKLFETYSPRGNEENFIKYFQDLGCDQFWSISFALPPTNVYNSSNFAGYLDNVLDTLDVGKINQSVYVHDSDETHISNTAPSGNVEISFDDLPFDAPDEYANVMIRWVDRSLSGDTSTSGGITAKYSGGEKTDYYHLSTGYAYHQLAWSDRTFTKEEVNSFSVVYHDGQIYEGLNLPYKRLTAIELVAQAVA